jgi:CubicO group peptidase (beta-lactamase class C family)
MPEIPTFVKWVIVVIAFAGMLSLGRGISQALRADPARSAAPPAEADGHSEELAALLEPIRARHKLPGLAAAIVSGGELREIAAVGVRRAGGVERLTIEDKFHIGSCTKAMTATMIAMLVEEGTISWGTRVGEVFHDVPMHEAWKAITLEQLVQHRGGAPDNLNAGGLWGRLWAFEGSPREARMELVRGVVKDGPRQPGEYLYSNAGFAIAGAMAERVTDTAWEELMRRRLFEPLGMTSCGFGAPGNDGLQSRPTEQVDQPRGHHASGKVEEPGPRADNPAAIGPAGTVHCSLADWARFVALHLGAQKRENGLLRTATIAKLQTPAEGPGEQYAMGWITTTRPWARGEGGQGLALTHAGSNTLWYAVVWMAPERDFAVLITANQGGATAARACDEVAGAIIRKIHEGAVI